MQETRFRTLGLEDPLEKGNGNPLQYYCLEKSHGQRSLVGDSPWGRKELDTTEPLHFDFSLSCIGEGNETHSSVLAWRIPWTEEPGGLQSIGLQRVRQLKQRSKQDIKRSICTTASPPV